jgi:hypothetical protein
VDEGQFSDQDFNFLSAAHIKGNMSNLTIKSFSFTLSNYYMFVYIVNSGTFIDVFELGIQNSDKIIKDAF